MKNQEGGLIDVQRIPALIKNLFAEISRFLISELSEEEKKDSIKIFIARYLYFLDKYFAQANLNLYNWFDKPLPDVPENEEARQELEKLKKKEEIMRGEKYREQFVYTYFKEWDNEGKYPQREFRSKDYEREMNKICCEIQEATNVKEVDKKERTAEAVQEELNILFDGILCSFEAMKDHYMNNIVRYIVSTVAIEHLLLFLKRTYLILEVDIRKHGRWRERSLALGKFILSLKEKINGFSGIESKTLVALHDILLSAELFLVEINNSIIENEKHERQERSQKELQETLENGFRKVAGRLSCIEEGVMVMNKQIANVNGRLSELLIVNKGILQEVEKNGRLIGSLSEKIDGISEQLSSIENGIFSIESLIHKGGE